MSELKSRERAGGRTVAPAPSGRRRSRAAPAGDVPDVTMDLQAFFPYRLAVLAEQVSLAVASAYATRFRLSRQEWRILAVVGARAEISTTEICRITTLEKMQVSRAIQSLEGRGIIRRFGAADDRRRKIVSLTVAGRSLYRQIVPLASRREAAILSRLSPQEIAQFDATMAKIAAAAAALGGGGRP